MESSSSQVRQAYQRAEETLRLIGRFGLPPSPRVYEVFFRYVEADEALHDAVQYAIDVVGVVDMELVDRLHRQFCLPIDNSSEAYGESLQSEMEAVEALIAKQAVASDEFGNSIESVNQSLRRESLSDEELRRDASIVMASNREMQQRLDSAKEQLEKSKRQVTILRNELNRSRKDMMTDPLTAIGNRRYFDTMVGQILARHAEGDGDEDHLDGTPEGASMFLVLIDVDRLKTVNDTHGHAAGDQLIRGVAGEIDRLHPEVCLSRIGGDEFAAFLQNVSRERCINFADSLRAHFGSKSIRLPGGDVTLSRITFSIGAARLRINDDAASWYHRADQYLYKAKEFGRDRSVVESGS